MRLPLNIAGKVPVLLLTVSLGSGTLLSAEEARKAVPVAEPGQEVPRAVPVGPGTPVAPPSAIPVKPKQPDEDLFEYATLCYTQKDYQIAIKPYSDYTRLYPQGPHAAEAWFRLGECYLKTNQNDQAKQAYSSVISKFPKSESAASASYRLGLFTYNDKDFTKAAQYFENCEKLTTDATVKLAATYNKALCYKLSSQASKAYTAFKTVVAFKGENPYRESSLVEVASSALEAGKKEEALSAYSDIISSVKEPSILGDALIKAGLLLNEAGKSEAALKNFKRALEISTLSKEARGVAVYGLIQGYYAKGDYSAVVDTYVANPTALPTDELRPKLLLMVANAQKQKQSYRQAVEIYLMIEKQFPDSQEAFEAGYQKLLCFYSLSDKDIPQFSESFEQRYAAQHKEDEHIMMSRLIRADWYFSKGDYTNATEAYSGVIMAKVPEKVRSSVLYKKGFAETEAGKYNDGIASLTEFLNNYLKDPNVPIALAQRGMCFKNVRSFEKALADFDEIIKKYPDNAAAEVAWYQTGQIKAEMRDLKGMITALEGFVAKFPHSAAAADAWYQIGRGYFEMKTKESFAKAIAPLHKALELDPKKWLDQAHQFLISAQYMREDVDGAAKEIDAYYGARPDVSVSPAVLTFVGERYYKRGDYKAAARYLTRATTPKEPANTPAAVWDLLGFSEVENGNYDAAIQALDNYMTQVTDGEGHARALYEKGRALLGQGKFDDAEACVTQSLSKVKEGALHAQLQLLQGDIAMGRGDTLESSGDHHGALNAWKKAAGNYVVVSQIFVDPQVTPKALEKAAGALEKLGDKEKADTLRKMLARDYPKYQGSEKNGKEP